MKSTPQRLNSDRFRRPDEISATKISLGRQRRERRRDAFSENKLSFTFVTNIVALVLRFTL
jgi:hypothetical protein